MGWQLLADHIQLRMGGISWPENQILLKYKKDQHSYQLFVKSIIIESLLSHAIDWPKSMQALLVMKPQGFLHDSQIMITANTNVSSIPSIPNFKTLTLGADELPQIELADNENQKNTKDNLQEDDNEMVFNNYSINYVLTRFEQLGWSAKDSIPEVHNLSGVINWQPDQGRLELDSENTSIKVNGYPEQILSLLNGAFDWKDLNDGIRISIDRFVISQPELTMSMQGVVDQVSRQSIGHIRLGAEFSGKNWQQWVAFLPKEYLKPKLYLWLKNDLKRIAEASGRIRLNGLAKDFPFDDNTGSLL